MALALEALRALKGVEIVNVDATVLDSAGKHVATVGELAFAACLDGKLLVRSDVVD